MHFLLRFALTALLCVQASAFALLGPFEEWQVPMLGYYVTGQEIGASKNLGDEYRWNVPVVTYGFDRAFLDYFGMHGVAAINEAMNVLNDLPRASEMDLDFFPLDARQVNLRAGNENLLDLKSGALILVLEQLGLSRPEESVWMLRDRNVFGELPITNYSVINRNFDPITWNPSLQVNGNRYTYSIFEFSAPITFADAIEMTIDVHQFSHTALAGHTGGLGGNTLEPGIFFGTLTRDDAGGLRYIYHPSNLNFENVPPGTTDWLGRTNFTNEALRPGVDKITFRKVTSWSDADWSTSVTWTDYFYRDQQLLSQGLKRRISRPDIVFSAVDFGNAWNFHKMYHRTAPNYSLSPAASVSAAGPGTMNGSVTITFNKVGPVSRNFAPYPAETTAWKSPQWGWFSYVTNSIVKFPVGLSSNAPPKLFASLISRPEGKRVEWIVGGFALKTYHIEQSHDLTNWTFHSSITTTNGINIFRTVLNDSPGRLFFRALSIQTNALPPP